jgi:hypothetical protein
MTSECGCGSSGCGLEGVLWAWLAVLGIGLVLSLAVVGSVWRASRHRWGFRQRGSVRVGTGAYREARLPLLERRGVPVGVGIAAVMTVGWSVITGLVFVPLGGLLALAAGLAGHPVGALIALGVAFSGGATSLWMTRAAMGAMRREPSADRGAIGLGLAHHVAVWIAVSWIASRMGGAELVPWAGLLAVPCGIGLVITSLLGIASRQR